MKKAPKGLVFLIDIFFRETPLPTWLSSGLIADGNENRDKDGNLEEKARRNFATWLKIPRTNQKEESDEDEYREPALPGYRHPTPTVQFPLEPVVLGIIFQVIDVIRQHLFVLLNFIRHI